jgi:CBS domain-containing protein
VVDDGRLVGILTSTNLVKRQAVSAVYLVGDIAKRDSFAGFAEVVGRVPTMLVQLVGGGVGAHDVGRIVTSVADALTRRLLTLAERKLGPAPVPWLWAACGSQGRREQTGVSDQDNCLILDDAYDAAAHGAYFAEFAKYVSDGLNAAGYFYCPGDMMATADRWRQPQRVWREYFRKWIAKPDEEAQMLASVMFDLRAIAGDAGLLDGLQAITLEEARKNSIFRAHMIRNSLKHQPPLGLFRGMATIRSGEHKDRIDMKLSGVVPIVDLGRVYALAGALTPVNTRERLVAAQEAKLVSDAGARDLIDAYDLIADMRLEHQARLVREGRKPDNFMNPALLSELERGHLRDAFLVVKTMQSAAANAMGMGA